MLARAVIWIEAGKLVSEKNPEEKGIDERERTPEIESEPQVLENRADTHG